MSVRRLFLIAALVAGGAATSAEVRLVESGNGREATFRSTSSAPNAKEAREKAVTDLFETLLNTGVDGLNGAQPMLAAPNESYVYRITSGKWADFVIGKPVKVGETSVGSRKQATMEVTVDLAGLRRNIGGGGGTLSPAWKDKQDAKPVDAAVRPSIMVVPYTGDAPSDFESMRRIAAENPAVRVAMAGVAGKFAARGYQAQDFSVALDNVKTDALLSANAQTDVATEVVRLLPGDIIVTVDAASDMNAQGTACNVTVTAVEKQTQTTLGSGRYASGRFRVNDPGRVAEYAVDKIEDAFFASIDNAFKSMIAQGRRAVIQFQLDNSVSDWDFDEPTPVGNEDFKDFLADWLREKSVGGVYNRSAATDKFIQATINIPIWDTERGRSYQLDNFASDLRKALRRVFGDEYSVKMTEMGQKILVTIK